MIEDGEDKDKTLRIFQTRDPKNFEDCYKKQCAHFNIETVGPGMTMYYCDGDHQYKGMVAV